VSLLAIGLLLVASMTAVSTMLTVADFRALAGRRSAVGIALVVNLVLLPDLAVAACALMDLRTSTTLGLVLAAAAPGGGTGALLTLYARGDLALSAALQGVLALLVYGLVMYALSEPVAVRLGRVAAS